MKPTELQISGCYLLQPCVFQNVRGRFVKPLVASQLQTRGPRTDFVEQCHSTSAPGVVRGMHFQMPPDKHAQMLCLLWQAKGSESNSLVTPVNQV